MKNRHYTYLLYFISFVILVTLGIQFYWNYKNYQTGKQQLINEVQASFGNAIDSYYIDLAKKNTVAFTQKNGGNILKNPKLDSILNRLDISSQGFKGLDSLYPENISSINVVTGPEIIKYDTVFKSEGIASKGAMDSLATKFQSDSLRNMLNIASRIIISITTDTMDIAALTPYINEQLATKNIEVDYGFIFQNKAGEIQKYQSEIIRYAQLATVSKSGYLPDESSFKIYFTNATATVLKRNLLGIVLSILLIGAVVFCLFFLLRIINQQKKLSELKNDLINNITHEFKTPISTIGAALEGIEHFNKENDPKKTKNYLQISNLQLGKLELMVEKLLETATLDGGDLQLNKEEIKVNEMLQNLVGKHKTLYPSKSFELKKEEKALRITADAFHLENAFNNILDNAVKYGGEKICIMEKTWNNHLEIVFHDNGNSLTKEQSEQLFDKFYRVPKGNTHDVKGFGIGLYYTKKIIEKHGGTVTVKLNNSTNFIVNLPYG